MTTHKGKRPAGGFWIAKAIAEKLEPYGYEILDLYREVDLCGDLKTRQI